MSSSDNDTPIAQAESTANDPTVASADRVFATADLIASKESAEDRESRIRVLELSGGPDPGGIPRDVEDFFLGRKLRVSLASSLPFAMQRLAKAQRVPVTINDVPAKQQPQVREWLLQAGYREVGGYFRRGDTILYKQPIDKFRDEGFKAFYRWEGMQPDPEREAKAIEDMVDGRFSRGVRVEVVDDEHDMRNHGLTTEEIREIRRRRHYR